VANARVLDVTSASMQEILRGSVKGVVGKRGEHTDLESQTCSQLTYQEAPCTKCDS
jgi:hypothetical protein